MKNEISIFNFESNSIRVIMDENGEPMFVGKDICEALCFTNHNKAMNDHCRGVTKRYPIIDSLGRTQDARVLYEPDVLRLIINCNLPAADPFERLVFEEILPSIRKTGQYSLNQQPKISLVPAAPEFQAALLIATLAGLIGNQAVLSANQAVKRIMGIDCLDLLGQKALVCEKQEIHLTPTDIANRIGIKSGATVNNSFEKLGIVESWRDHKNRKCWKVTPKGLEFALMKDTGKKNSGGMIQQLYYLESAIGLLEQ